MISTITTEQQNAIANFLKGKHIPRGLGTKEEACSITAINLALTGELKDEIPACMSEVIGKTIIRLQDLMPDTMRNSQEWRNLLPLAAGTGRSKEPERLVIIMDWMWTIVLPLIQTIADSNGLGNEWKVMLSEKTYAAAGAASYAAAEAGAASYAAEAASYAASYAASAASYAAEAAEAEAAAEAAYAAGSASAAGYAADAAEAASYAASYAASAASYAASAAEAASYAAYAAGSAASYAASAAEAAAEAAYAAGSAGAASYAASYAAYAAAAASYAAAYWNQINPCTLLRRMIDVE